MQIINIKIDLHALFVVFVIYECVCVYTWENEKVVVIVWLVFFFIITA